MVELNNAFKLLRMVVFGTWLLIGPCVCGTHLSSVATTSFFALIVIILGALVTNFSDKFLDGFFNYAALGIATGLLTLLTLPTMFVYRTISFFFFFFWCCTNLLRLALSMVRKGAVTSMIAVEIAWTCKSQLVFHTDIQYDPFFFFFFFKNQGSSGSCGSLLVVILQVVSSL